MEVSVIIPVHMAEAFIRDAVHSALQQMEVKEVILVEDGSMDGSLRRCQEMTQENPRVRLIRHPGGVNKGVSASRNLGIRSARSEFVAFLDSDDRFLPGRFTAEKAVWTAHPDADGVYGAIGAHFHDEESRERFQQRFSSTLTTVRVAVPPEQLFPAFAGLAGILDFGHFSLNGATFRRESLLRMPGLLREDLAIGEDTEFLMRAAYHLRLYPGCITEPIALRSVHPGNRFTRSVTLPRSRRIMYRALLEWAIEQAIGAVSLRRIGETYAGYALHSAEDRDERQEALNAVRRFPGALKRLDNVEALVDLWFGRVKPIAAALKFLARGIFKAGWALKGGAPPEVKASWARQHQRTE